MKKYLTLILILLYSTLLSQQIEETFLQIHDIFYYWDMDKYDCAHNGKGSPGTDWHDMDFKCNPKQSLMQYEWKLELGNASTSYESGELELSTYKTIYPTWDSPTPSVAHIDLPSGFVPTYYSIYFYNNGAEDVSQRISNKQINIDDIYLYDKYHYYVSEINSFSASVDLQTGNIDLDIEVLQPDMFYLTVEVNQNTSPIEDEYYHLSSSNWLKIQTIDDLSIDATWLNQFTTAGNRSIKLILNSKMWNDGYYTHPVPNTETILLYYDPYPSAPQNLTIGESAIEHPDLSWTANSESDLDYYNIYRKDDYPQVDWRIIATAPSDSNSYEDTEVTTTYRHGEDFWYKVTAVDDGELESGYSNTVEIEARLEKQIVDEEIIEKAPKVYTLHSNYPNPFNPTTQISYQIPNDGFVSLVVYNSVGQTVENLVNERQSTGRYSVEFNATNLPSGVYFYRIKADNYVDVKKMLILK